MFCYSPNQQKKVEVKFAWQISCPPVNGASLGSYLVKIDFFVKKGENRLTKIALAAKIENLSWKHIFKISFSNLKLKLVHFIFYNITLEYVHSASKTYPKRSFTLEMAFCFLGI